MERKFCKKANQYFAKNNIDKKIYPLTFEEQRREELPQIHLETASYQMEKKGIKTERGNINRIIIAFNKEFKASQEELKEAGRFITSMISRVKNM
ncbi:MAG: hypothetical protein ACRDA4_01770 [Filifactoraceae bacterium]